MTAIPNDSTSYRGHEVVDDHTQKVGVVTDVVYDVSGQPEWIVVDPGVLRSSHYVPIAGSYVTEDGALTIPFSKSQVKSAPKAASDHIVTTELERQLLHHYELV